MRSTAVRAFAVTAAGALLVCLLEWLQVSLGLYDFMRHRISAALGGLLPAHVVIPLWGHSLKLIPMLMCGVFAGRVLPRRPLLGASCAMLGLLVVEGAWLAWLLRAFSLSQFLSTAHVLTHGVVFLLLFLLVYVVARISSPAPLPAHACRTCGYDLRGLTAGCPECGTTPEANITYIRR